MRNIIFVIISIILALITVGGIALLIIYGSIELFQTIFIIVIGIAAIITLTLMFYNLIDSLYLQYKDYCYELELEKKRKEEENNVQK